MKFLRPLGLVVIVLAVLTAAGSVAATSFYRSKSVLVQRVQKDEAADLFGEAGTPIGSPQPMIIEDEKAFLPQPGENGVKLVDDGYLQKHNIYPLQMKTVEFVARQVQFGTVAGLIVGILLFLVGRRKTAASVE